MDGFLGLILGIVIMYGINDMLMTTWNCRYCGKMHDTGIFIAMLNDWFGISFCNHNGNF